MLLSAVIIGFAFALIPVKEEMKAKQVRITLVTFDAQTEALIPLYANDYSMTILLTYYDTDKTEVYPLMSQDTPTLILNVANRDGLIRIIILPSRNPHLTINLHKSYIEPRELPNQFETWTSDGKGDTKQGQQYLTYTIPTLWIFEKNLDDIFVWMAIERR